MTWRARPDDAWYYVRNALCREQQTKRSRVNGENPEDYRDIEATGTRWQHPGRGKKHQLIGPVGRTQRQGYGNLRDKCQVTRELMGCEPAR